MPAEVTSDAAVKARHAIAEDLQRLDRARVEITDLLDRVDALRPAHRCHVCATKTREKE